MSAEKEETLTIDDEGITRRLGDDVKRVRWDDLLEVAIRTTDAGLGVSDVFFVLVSCDGSVCAVPADLEESSRLLERLQRLPGFDSEKVSEAMGSTQDARFTCWRKGGD